MNIECKWVLTIYVLIMLPVVGGAMWMGADFWPIFILSHFCVAGVIELIDVPNLRKTVKDWI